MDKLLKGKTALVTGAASGIGEAIAVLYGQQGARVMLSDTDEARGQAVAEQLDTGMVFINHPTWTQADLPFGGTKRSGYGRELSELGISEFVNKKLIRVSALTDPF